MKKFDLKSAALGFIIGTVGIATVFAANGIKSATFTSSKVYFYGNEVPLKNQLVSIVKEGEENAQIYMPVRELLEYMNFIVEWNGNDNSITLTMRGNNGNSGSIETNNNNDYSENNSYNGNLYNFYPSKLSQSEADKKAITIMDNSGTWGQQIEALLPYMSATGVEKIVTIYLNRHLFPEITTPQAAKKVATTIETALKYMTEDAKKAVEDRISVYY